MRYITFIFCALYFASCNVFVSNQKLQARHQIKNDQIITIYSVSGNALSNDAIIINNESNNTKELIDIYESYNSLENSTMLNDSSLQIVIKDSKSFHNTSDTFVVNITKYHPL